MIELDETFISNEYLEAYKAVKKNGSALEHQVSANVKNDVVFAWCISRIHSDTDDWVRKKYIYKFFIKEILKVFGFPMACFALYLIGVALPPVFLCLLSLVIFISQIIRIIDLIYYPAQAKYPLLMDYLKECIDLKGKINQYRLGYLLSRDLLNMGPTFTVTTNLPKGVKEVSAFQYEGWTCLTHAVLPESVNEIGYEAFRNCTNLATIIVPESVRLIGPAAFMNCSSITNFTIPKNVEGISPRTFDGCTSLFQVSIPNSLRYIDPSSFQRCPNLKAIEIYNSNAVDYKRILDLLPPEQQHLAIPLIELKESRDIKQKALKSVAALSMSGLTANLLFKMLNYRGTIAGQNRYPVDTKSFFSRLHHARQPALALALTLDVSRPNPYQPFPEYAEKMLDRLCWPAAVRLNTTVAHLRLAMRLTSPEAVNSLFKLVTTTALPHFRMLQNCSKKTQDDKVSSVEEIETLPPKLGGSGR